MERAWSAWRIVSILIPHHKYSGMAHTWGHAAEVSLDMAMV